MNLRKGLTGHWLMRSIDNSKFRDHSAKDNYGELKEDQNMPESSNGIIDQSSLKFEGLEEEYADIIGVPEKALKRQGTILVWVKPHEDINDLAHVFHAMGDGTSLNSIGWIGSTPRISINIRDDGRYAVVMPWDEDGDSHEEIYGQIKYDEWQLLAIAWDDEVGDEGIRRTYRVYDGELFLEAEEIGSYMKYFEEDSVSNVLRLGSPGDTTHSRRYKGKIGDFRIYNRVLSEKEIKIIANSRNKRSRRA